MENKILITPNTIILTIGISNCGKSYFCENHLLPFFHSHPITYQYLSSDNIRRTLLNDGTKHKHDPEMMQVSKQAFNILHNLLDNYTQYPVNTSVVIVDATNLSAIARKDIFDLAKKNHYNVVGLLFDYKDSKDYFTFSTEKERRVIAEHLKSFKEKTLASLEKKEFSKIYKITDLDFTKYNFVYEESNINLFDTSKYERYCIIGDPHGCFEEVLECVLDNKGLSYHEETGLLEVTDPLKYHHHIFVGDYLDKGPQILKLLQFLYDNRQFFTFVIGNHENFVYKFLKGELGSYEKQKELIDGYFNSILLLQNNEIYKQMFFELFESSYNYVKGSNFIVTHAPCSTKYLGKNDSESIKNQRTIRYTKEADFNSHEEYLDAFEKMFSFLNEEADQIHPFHFFGHVALKRAYVLKNKYGIDTGCVSGNELMTACITEKSRKPFLKAYRSKQPNCTDKLHTMFRIKEHDLSLAGLEIELQRRLRWAEKNQLNFISGTMSPVNKSENDLEDLKQGLLYYFNKGVKKIILQPKFMGSRANILLHISDVEKCKVFSRSGYLIQNDRLTLSTEKTLDDLLKELQVKYASLFEIYNAEYILFDGELLPWKVMGKQLIEKDFRIPEKALGSEIRLLKDSGFEIMLETFKNKMHLHSILRQVPSEHVKSQMKVWEEFKQELQSLSDLEKGLEKYSKQLTIFASDGELEYKPFSILKTIRKDGSEENFISSSKSNIEIFKQVSDETYTVIDFENKVISIRESDSKMMGIEFDFSNTETTDQFISLMFDHLVKLYWNTITVEKQMEGVVIKPDSVYTPGLAPYLKCRNKEYLRIIYGMDYDTLEVKKDKLIRSKNITHKLNTSIKEWELGRKLLDIPIKDISIENKKWIYYCTSLMNEQEGESNLDPRL